MKRDEFETGVKEILEDWFDPGLFPEEACKEIMKLFDLHDQQELNMSLLEKMSNEAGYVLEYDPISKQIVRVEEEE